MFPDVASVQNRCTRSSARLSWNKTFNGAHIDEELIVVYEYTGGLGTNRTVQTRASSRRSLVGDNVTGGVNDMEFDDILKVKPRLFDYNGTGS